MKYGYLMCHVTVDKLGGPLPKPDQKPKDQAVPLEARTWKDAVMGRVNRPVAPSPTPPKPTPKREEIEAVPQAESVCKKARVESPARGIPLAAASPARGNPPSVGPPSQPPQPDLASKVTAMESEMGQIRSMLELLLQRSAPPVVDLDHEMSA
eukprot:5801234-Amphidinium_carterae.1